MPTYDYQCLSCGMRFESYQGIKEEPLDSCPDCTGVVKRIITGGSGFIIKGGSSNGELQRPTCGKETTCCGSEYSCGKSGDCHE